MAKKTLKSQTSGSKNGQKTNSRGKSKKDTCIALLKRARGASLAELQKATGWQAHSVRGFLSGTVKKLPGLALVSKQTEGAARRYHIEIDKAS